MMHGRKNIKLARTA